MQKVQHCVDLGGFRMERDARDLTPRYREEASQPTPLLSRLGAVPWGTAGGGQPFCHSEGCETLKRMRFGSALWLEGKVSPPL